MKTVFGAILAVVLLGSVGVAQAQDEPPPPPTVYVQPVPTVPVQTETRSYRGELIGSGLVAFGISYGAAVAVAATSDHKGDNHLYVPIVGPWIDIANRGSCDIDKTACDGETTNKVLLVIDGVFQGAGAVSVIGGLLTPPSETRTTVASKKVHIVPVSYGTGSPGLAAFGRF